jgi:hypothetical protein
MPNQAASKATQSFGAFTNSRSSLEDQTGISVVIDKIFKYGQFHCYRTPFSVFQIA